MSRWRRLIEGMSWWQPALALVPLTLAFVGGAVGGLIGGAAALACAALARRGWHVALGAISMVCVDALAFGGYLGVAAVLLSPHAVPQAVSASQQSRSCGAADRSGSDSAATSPTSVPALPPGVEPVSAPASSGTTSANADEVLLRSGNGEDIGQGQSDDYTGAQVDVSGTVAYVRVSAGPYDIVLQPSSRSGNFTCGTYAGATQNYDGSTPELSIDGNSRGCDSEAGTFTIYQIATTKKGELAELNATFSHTCGSSPAPLVGLIRYNATTPTPIPALPSSAKPITPPANSGTTSAHPDEFSVLSAPGDVIGGGQPFDSVGQGVSVGGTLGTVHVGVANWRMTLSAPLGEQLVPGTYPAATSGVFPGAGPGISMSNNSLGCDNDYGTFTIYQIVTSTAGDITQLNATFTHTCESTSAPPLVGFIRFNATTSTPIPVLPPSAG